MKKLLLLIVLNCILWNGSYAQPYGWIDISNNLPSSISTASLSDLHFISNDEGWICSSALGEIYHTTDGGQTFTTQTTQYYTNAIYMLDSLLGYAGGIQGRVYKTTDGGANWDVHGSIGSTLSGIDFPPNSDSGYCCGDQGNIYKITSTGIISMSSGITTNLRSISFPSSGLGWTCGGGIILHYDGNSWYEQDSPVGSSYNSINMCNDSTGCSVGAFGRIIKTTDSGSYWFLQTSPINSSLNNVFFLDNNLGWAVGGSGVVLHTTNGGTNWNIEIDGWTSNMLRSVQFTSPTNGYVLGNNRTLFKYTLLTGVEEPPRQPLQASSFNLYPSHPNPFNPSTALSYELRAASNVSLKVYDTAGRLVATLVEGWRQAGTHGATFNGKGLASGIYLAELEAGEFKAVQQLVLLK